MFRETKFNLCGADKVLQEHILLNFEIPPKKLKEMRQQIAKDIAAEKDEAGAGNDPGQTTGGVGKVESEKKSPSVLFFAENDALTFDPGKFLNLLTQMER